MKRRAALLLVLLPLLLAGCQEKEEVMDCTIFWQLYQTPKYVNADQIERIFQRTFFNFYDRVNDNTAVARNTTKRDVRSLTVKLATMADAAIGDTTDPADSMAVEVRVFINFADSYVEEVWSKSY